jgi:sterol desaturase/sphingolipid hydroxylase (fatty acid hydroxylase superfamily)
MHAIWSFLVDALTAHAIAPFLVLVHLDGLAGDPREIAGAVLIAIAQVFVIACVFRPLESLAPAEPWVDRSLTRIDRTYTLVMLFGLNPLFAYLVLTPLANAFAGGAPAVPDAAVNSGLAHWLPWFDHHPLVLFFVYYVIYDFTYYWMHRTQHWIPWWWALHSMHHSQRQMSCWTNDRGSYVDGFLQSMVLATAGLVIGVDPEQFALLMFIGELAQNFSHANVRFGFGRLFEKVLVDPKFHRLHHMRVDPDRPTLHDCNYGQVLSVWDVLFGTALYGEPPRETGVGDPMVDADNGRGLVAMQWGAFRRFWGAVWTRAGWIPGDVAFDADHRPIPTAHADLHRYDRERRAEPENDSSGCHKLQADST